MSNALECFNSGQLTDAIHASISDVREHPNDVDMRWTLATLLCFGEDLDRADKHLQVILTLAPDLAGEVLLFRNLLRGEIARRQCFEEGRVPSFPEPPSKQLQLLLRSLSLQVGGEPEEYARMVQQAAAELPSISGECNGQEFVGIRDWDDFLAGVLEVITINGDYYWLGLGQVQQIRFDAVEEMRDVIWRSAEITTTDGASLSASFPLLYPGTAGDADESIRLGRAAEWIESPAGVMRGKGARSFEIGGETIPLTQIDLLRLNPVVNL